jgi:DivIVA domain-containing protein
MEMTPQEVRATGFRVVKKGYDPDEVDAFKDRVAGAVDQAQSQAAAMEARARAAVAKLQEVSQQMAASESAVPPSAPAAPAGTADHDAIGRALLLAQRTADAYIAESRAEGEQLVATAREEAGRILDSARTMAAKAVDEARSEARRASEDEQLRAEAEVQSLLARRDFLLADVESLEQYVQAQRERLLDTASSLLDLAERVPGGLGDLRRPLMSAAGSERVVVPPPVLTPDPVLDPTEPLEHSSADITAEQDRPADDPFHIGGDELQ